MRRMVFALAASVPGIVFMAPEAGAQAWMDNECTVSITWPYAREAGDCLTDNEKAAGATGTYGDPEGSFFRSPVAVAALRNLEGCALDPGAPAPAIERASLERIVRGAPNTRIALTGSNFRCNTQVYLNAVPIPTMVLSPTQLEVTVPEGLTGRAGNFPLAARNRAPVVAMAFAGQNQATASLASPPPAAAGAANAPEGPREITNARGCTTGVLWPYFRDPGDCLTDAEREGGLVGVYGNSRLAGEPEPEGSNIVPLPAASGGGGGGPFGWFGRDQNDFGGGGLLEDNLLPPEQRNQ